MLATLGSVAGQNTGFKGVIYDSALLNPNVLNLSFITERSITSGRVHQESELNLYEVYVSNTNWISQNQQGYGWGYFDLSTLNIVESSQIFYRVQRTTPTNYIVYKYYFTDGTDITGGISFFSAGYYDINYTVPNGKTLKGVGIYSYISNADDGDGMYQHFTSNPRMRLSKLEVL